MDEYEIIGILKKFYDNVGKYIILIYGGGMILVTLAGVVTLFFSWIWLIISIAVVMLLFFMFGGKTVRHSYEGDL